MNHYFNLTKNEVVKLSAFAVCWRLVLFAIGSFGHQFLVYKPSFPYAYTLLTQFNMPLWLYSWANFDGVHYLTIADKGYEETALIQAFFPLYPLLTRIINTGLDNVLISGLLISNVSFILSVLVLYSLVKRHYSQKTASFTVLAYLLFPTSFFLGAFYSESLFILVVLLAFYAASSKKWLFAGLLIALASATRIVGIFLIPALVVELYSQFSSKQFKLRDVYPFVKNKTKELCFICLGLVGIGVYMIYLQQNFGDPLYFWHVQSEFGAGREETIIVLPQVVWRYFKILHTVPLSREWLVYFQELFFGLVPLCCIAYYWFKSRLRTSWALFSVLTLLLPTVTGTFSSMPRYALAAFPLFLIMAFWFENKVIRVVVIAISAILLLFNLLLFIQGYWIA